MQFQSHRTASFWTFSLLWGFLASLPHTLGTISCTSGSPWTTCAGCILYVFGLSLETIADWQKWKYKQLHPGKLCTVGVWSMSQHPNWFGNLVLWCGILLLNIPGLTENVGRSASPPKRLWASRRLILALISPLFLWSLFSAQTSGRLTSTLQLANTKYGMDPVYWNYVESVPLIILNPLKLIARK